MEIKLMKVRSTENGAELDGAEDVGLVFLFEINALRIAAA